MKYTQPNQPASLSANALSQADSATLARSAARWYFAFSAGVTRRSIRAVAGSGIGGLPLGRLSFSMDELCATQIMLDKPFDGDILYTH
jgi:hypothetical protein